jgi:chemotaxis family two-component system response regulator PixG
MSFESSGLAQILGELAKQVKRKGTGKWLIEGDRRKWHLYFVMGQLIWATGEFHRCRRWIRAVKQHCPHWEMDAAHLSVDEPWEYHLLHHAIARENLNVSQAKQVISSVALEVFFDLANHTSLSSRWIAEPAIAFEIPMQLPLSSSQIGQVLQKAKTLWKQWREMDLGYLYPDLAPVLSHPQRLQNQVSSESFLTLNTLFNGDNTLWDLAIERKQSPIGVIRTLHHFVQQGKIALQDVPDCSSPLEQIRLVRAATQGTPPQRKRTIACIDDSPAISERLSQILAPEGYKVVQIRDPMEGVATLAREKPDLIFLDVVMPQTNGYNLCTFLRQSELFRNTPIVILTSQDGLLDRTRAKLIGASDFLSKPPEPTKVLQIVQKYLDEESAVPGFSGSSPAIA